MAIKLKKILEASGEIAKGSWIELSGKALHKFKDELSDLISIAHSNQKTIPSSDIKDKEGYKYMAINTDADAGPDAVRIYKEKGSGKVVVGVGHDGSSTAKQQLYTMNKIQKGIADQDEGLLSTLVGIWRAL